MDSPVLYGFSQILFGLIHFLQYFTISLLVIIAKVWEFTAKNYAIYTFEVKNCLKFCKDIRNCDKELNKRFKMKPNHHFFSFENQNSLEMSKKGDFENPKVLLILFDTTLLQISSWGRIVHFDIHAHLKIWVHSDSFTNSTYSRNCSLHASRYYCGSSRLYFIHEIQRKGWPGKETRQNLVFFIVIKCPSYLVQAV